MKINQFRRDDIIGLGLAIAPRDRAIQIFFIVWYLEIGY